MTPAPSAIAASAPRAGGWRHRYTLVVLCCAATFICYLDRTTISVAIIPMAQQFGWGPERQGTILSAFFIGYMLTQILGGRLADRYGGKVVLAAGVLVWSAFTLVTPLAASLGLGMLIAARIGLGIGEGVTFPSVYSLVGRWIPTSERGRAISLNATGVPLGAVIALVVTPIIVQSMGWPWAFYLFGALGFVWFLPWQWKTSSSPATHPRIGADELEEIRSGGAEQRAGDAPAWGDLLRRAPVWAIIVAHFCNNWSLYVLLSWLPTFVNQGLGVDFSQVGMFTLVPNIAGVFFLNIAGGVADRMIKSGMDTTRVRKILQTFSFAGIAGSLFLVGLVESPFMAIGIMTVGTAISAFASGGFSVNPVDIAPRHAGTVMGLSNTFATIPGIVGVYVSGLILERTGSWAMLFGVAAGVTIFGMLFYLVFGSSKRLFE
jgi:ACS family sodium-dependent inorganic phosphate cotransporter